MSPALQDVQAVDVCPQVVGARVGFWVPRPTWSGNRAHVCQNPIPTSSAHRYWGEKSRIASFLPEEVCSLCRCERSAPTAEPGHRQKAFALSGNLASDLCWEFDLVQE